MTGSVAGFFAYARERETVAIKRYNGFPAPWTEDPVLQAWRFCNVFREDDRTTAWFRVHVRDPLKAEYRMSIVATVAFRWFNRISTGSLIKDVLLTDGWHERRIRAALKDHTGPLVTGAYIIMPCPGKASINKLDGICQCMAALGPVVELMVHEQPDTLQQAHEFLMQAPGLGPFMAYEVITDLRHTTVLRHATDKDTWANPGPGAKRGLQHVYGLPRTTKLGQLTQMQSLLEESRKEEHWPQKWRAWEMREVEHTLCEYDKYIRGCNGQALKRKFTP